MSLRFHRALNFVLAFVIAFGHLAPALATSISSLTVAGPLDALGRVEVGYSGTIAANSNIGTTGATLVSASSVVVYNMISVNPLTASAYIQLYCRNTTPSGGDAADWWGTGVISAGSVGVVSLPSGGIKCSNGVTAAWSTTAATFTAGTASGTNGATRAITR